jgi:hypothetical protein
MRGSFLKFRLVQVSGFGSHRPSASTERGRVHLLALAPETLRVWVLGSRVWRAHQD